MQFAMIIAPFRQPAGRIPLLPVGGAGMGPRFIVSRQAGQEELGGSVHVAIESSPLVGERRYDG